MRAKDVARMVKSWKEILHQVRNNKLDADIGILCLEVVGQYVEWIDINLVSSPLVLKQKRACPKK